MDKTGTKTIVARLRRVILPQTRVGWVGLWLVIAFLAIFQSSQTIADAWDSDWVAIFFLPLAISGLAAGVAAATAISRRGDRGLLVFVPLLVALLIVWFVVGEATTSH